MRMYVVVVILLLMKYKIKLRILTEMREHEDLGPCAPRLNGAALILTWSRWWTRRPGAQTSTDLPGTPPTGSLKIIFPGEEMKIGNEKKRFLIFFKEKEKRGKDIYHLCTCVRVSVVMSFLPLLRLWCRWCLFVAQRCGAMPYVCASGMWQ
ncbi:unnamed protein product [Trypanosoma congolense IL3000]|uniref:WGS project CAEQ00000000 data, annotated contig 471 n=1 Tax=Trypanosoma congolense (strain IL3000) TaxID=1068625 RepID=F9WG70_TRYCI|nr:unnamed protein product [Trypanosoma congolense IL3000]